jgi:tetratricopeptide (TPR) repeat protein
MNTLYDLLGALPSDDAEGLRIAFRKAVKGAHPDIHPDDPDAALKFREIVRANEILIDDEQRTAYDHLLKLAHEESSRQATAARIYRAASAVIAFAVVSVVTAGGYLLFMHVSATSLIAANPINLVRHAAADIAAVSPAASPEAANKSTLFAKADSAAVPGEAIAPGAWPDPDADYVPAANVAPTPDPRSLRAQGVLAYRNGDLNAALAALDQAIDLDPKYLDAYIDRGIVLYRLQKFDRAYADLSRAKRIEKAGHSKASPLATARPRFNQAGMMPLMPLPQRRPSGHRLWPERVTSAAP